MRKQANVFYSKSIRFGAYVRCIDRRMEWNMVMVVSICVLSGESIRDFAVFPNLEGTFPDLDNHFHILKIALDLH